MEKLTDRNSYTPNIEEVHEAQRFLLSQYSDIIRFKRGETQEKRKTTATQLASSQFVSEDNNASTRQADEQPEEDDDDDDDEKRRRSFDPTSKSFLSNTEPAAMQARETRNKSRATRPIYFLTKSDANAEKLIKVVPSSGNISTFEASTFEKIKNNSRQVFFTEPATSKLNKRQMRKRKGSLESVKQEPQGSKRQKTEQP